MLPEDHLIRTKMHGRPPVTGWSGFPADRVSRVTTRRARTNPRRQTSSLRQCTAGDKVESGQRHTRSQQQAAEEPERRPCGEEPLREPSTRARRRRPPRAQRRPPEPAPESSCHSSILLFLSHRPVLLGHPVPGVQTADDQPDDQQRQCPGMAVLDGDGPARHRAPRRASVGTTTDQPMSPIMPRPNQTPARSGAAP